MRPVRKCVAISKWAAFAGAAVVVGALAACSSAVSVSKLQEIHDGMKPSQVTALLGQPTRIDHAEITGLTGDVYYYPARNGSAKVVFVDDTVFTTGFIPEPTKPL
jgi:hypothetical protein